MCEACRNLTKKGQSCDCCQVDFTVVNKSLNINPLSTADAFILAADKLTTMTNWNFLGDVNS